MILFHGSNVAIEKIDLSKSRPGKDFGKGFYLSANESQAIEMAESKVAFLGGDPIVTAFEFDESLLSSGTLDVKLFDGYTETWARFVYENRENFSDIPIHHYDIVYGPRADDRVGAQIRSFKNGSIDLNELINRIKYLKGITFQYYFGTDAAIQSLHKL